MFTFSGKAAISATASLSLLLGGVGVLYADPASASTVVETEYSQPDTTAGTTQTLSEENADEAFEGLEIETPLPEEEVAEEGSETPELNGTDEEVEPAPEEEVEQEELSETNQEEVEITTDEPSEPAPKPDPEPEPTDSHSFEGMLSLNNGGKRLSGSDRYATAVKVSQQLFPGAKKADEVFIASGSSFPDGLTLGALASYKAGPLLLTGKDRVPQNVLNEIRRLQPKHIYIGGGKGAVSSSVYYTLKGITPNVTRLSGPDRYGTAARIAAEFPVGAGAMIATGSTFPDALVASAASSKNSGGAAVILTKGFIASPDATAALRKLQPKEVVVVGGTWSEGSRNKLKAASNATEFGVVSGKNRYETSGKLAKKYWGGGSLKRAIYATGTNYPDALAATPAGKAYDAPILLTKKDCHTAAVPQTLSAADGGKWLLVGGTGVLANSAATKVCPTLPAKVYQSGGFYRFGMTPVDQSTGYWCGPATGVMILSRLGYGRSVHGVALSQRALASDRYMRTDRDGKTSFADSSMARGLNNWMGKTVYKRSKAPNTATFRKAVSSSFTSTGRPVVVDVNEIAGGPHYNGHPAYSSFSHLMPIEGYNPSTDTLIALDSIAYAYPNSSRQFSHNLGQFTGYLRAYGMYY